jgi:hypothetical protein
MKGIQEIIAEEYEKFYKAASEEMKREIKQALGIPNNDFRNPPIEKMHVNYKAPETPIEQMAELNRIYNEVISKRRWENGSISTRRNLLYPNE